MATPIPIDFYVSSQPKVRPESVQELLNTIGDSLTAVFESGFNTASIIFGQLNGILPGTNVGPWSNGASWWFWDATKGAYSQGLDGVPIGLIMMWGGQGTPLNWLACDGSEISRTIYSDLFQAVGTTWGPGDNSTTFNLPPGGVAFINAPGFVPDPLVTLAPNTPPGAAAIVSIQPSEPSGVACVGGSQLAPLLSATNLPPMQLLVPFITVQKQQPGISGLGLPKPYSNTSAQPYIYQVQNNEGAQLNNLAADQSQFPTMPPFATANYIIKYQ